MAIKVGLIAVAFGFAFVVSFSCLWIRMLVVACGLD